MGQVFFFKKLPCPPWKSNGAPLKLYIAKPTLTAKNTPLFLFPYMGHSLQIFAWGMPLHAHVFSFTHNAVVLSHFKCVHPENQTKILRFEHFYESKQTSLTQDFEVIAKQRSALQVEFITGVKLICYFELYFCFLHWDHLPNKAVGDLAFHYTQYLWCELEHNVYGTNQCIWGCSKILVMTYSQRIKDEIFILPILRWCHNGWATNILSNILSGGCRWTHSY